MIRILIRIAKNTMLHLQHISINRYMPRRINMLYTSRVESCYQYLKQNTKYWKSNDKSYTLQNENLFKVI